MGTANASPQRLADLLERIASHAPLQDTLDALSAFIDDQLPGARGALQRALDNHLAACAAHASEAEKLDAVARLAGGVAHGFNNLLTVINGYSDALLEQLPHGSPVHADVATIREAGDRAASLTAQLLAFGQRTMIAPRPLDLNALVERLARLCAPLLGDHIRLELALAPALAEVMADAAQLEQVVMNLVINARDAMPHGGVLTLATRSATAPTGPHVSLSIADTGAGMTDDVRAHAFEPFFTTKAHRQGLGLATARGIVEQARGQLLVETTPGRGCVFSVVLPAIAPQPASAAPPEVLRRRPRATETVLLAEDEDGVRRLVQRALEHQGYRVLPARSGEEAERIARAHHGPIDLLVTDVVMPGMGGRELADALKARRPQLKVLYMSGYTNDEVIRYGVTLAHDAFLQKPFTPTRLVAMVRATVATRAAHAHVD